MTSHTSRLPGLLFSTALGLVGVLQGCSSPQGDPDDDGTAGTRASGGASGATTTGGTGGALGGTSGAGGSASGGSAGVGTGGVSGGGSGSAGVGTGGLGGSAGFPPLGGAGGGGLGGAAGVAGDGSGGSLAGSAGAGLGGTAGVAGFAGSGGTAGAGGTAGVGGTSGFGGIAGAGGTAGSGGTAGKGGSAGAGGSAGKGGSAGSGGGSCLTPPALDPVLGWASVNGMNQNGTTGGGNATPQVVTTLQQFTQAVSGTNAAVIHLNAKLPPANVAIGSNKTIVGVCGAEFHGHMGFSRSANVIIHNLKIVGYGVGDCSKDPDFSSAVGCSSGQDAISVSTQSHHIWFDHCDVSDGTDGNLDINNGSDFVTISWTKFHYTARTDNVGNDSTGANGHRYSNLIGSGDDVDADVGHLNVTFHHCWWADNVNQRMPRTRRGKIHVVNNLYSSAGNSWCTNSGFETHLLVENNIYTGVRNPLSPDANGDMLARNNVFTNTTGTTMAMGTGFTPPYTYTPEPTSGLEAAIRSGAGPK